MTSETRSGRRGISALILLLATLALLVVACSASSGDGGGAGSDSRAASRDASEPDETSGADRTEAETMAAETAAETAAAETTAESTTGAREAARLTEDGGAPATALVVPSLWEGEMQGQVYGQAFRLPVTVEFTQPLPNENNPVHVFVGSGSFYQVGDLGLYSASENQVSTGLVTLQYFTVEVQGTQLRAVLTDDHVSEAATINQFIAPNVTAQYAPPGPGSQVYENLGPTEFFAFREGTELVLGFSGDQLTGSVRGLGASLDGIFPIPDVGYQAEFVVNRVS